MAVNITASAGIGLRAPHIESILRQDQEPGQAIPWLELLVDNWLAAGGFSRHYLLALAERYPLTLHGVGLSLAGIEPLDLEYLAKIRTVMRETDALWYSEHLCFSQLGFSQLASHFSHDLLPVPYTEALISHLSTRISQVQDFLGVPLLVENVSSYVTYKQSTLSEGAFINELVANTGCELLLDVNNFYVNQVNHGQDALTEIRLLPHKAIKEIHLAGYADKGRYLIDAHNTPVSDAVWDLYTETLQLTGTVATLIEWDNDIPPLDILLQERSKAQCYLDELNSTPDSTIRGTPEAQKQCG